MTHEDYMRRAIAMAKKGGGWTHPNPQVGAVIVKDGHIIAEGYHCRCGQLHAERNAIANLKESAEGATIYVTLEPCCHYGKQPPCTLALIEAGIKTVYIGSRDPNPLVSGKGARLLREHGITVIEDFLQSECDELNHVFFHYITTKRPYVVMKYAMTMDGKIATKDGDSQWITGEVARCHVHQERGKYASILAGIGTVLADDPMLNCRLDSVEEGTSDAVFGVHQPLRIVLDSKLRIPLESQIVRTAKEYPTLVVCALDLQREKEKVSLLEALGLSVVSLGECGQVSISKLMDYLGEQQIDSIYVEGGGMIHDAFRQAGVVNQVDCYIGPKIFGGTDAKTPVEGQGVSKVAEGLKLENMSVTQLGKDIYIKAYVYRNC